jgi:hypothetical protein
MEKDSGLQSGFKTAVIISTAFIGTLFIYAFVAEFIKKTYSPFEGFLSEEAFPSIIKSVFYGFSFSLFVLIPKIRKFFLDRLPSLKPERRSPLLIKTQIITNAFCEIPANLGLVLFMIEGSSRDLYFLSGLSLFLLLICFPRVSTWSDLLMKSR